MGNSSGKSILCVGSCNNEKRSSSQLLDSETENWSFFSNLTDELVTEILIRLPSESVIRCKAVCKWWRTLIHDGDYFFTRRHQFHDENPQVNPFTLLLQPLQRATRTRVNIISEHFLLHKLYGGCSVDTKFLPFQPMAYGPWEFQLETSCADLLLCSYSDRLSFKIIYYICNLLTKQWIALPPIPMDSVWAEVGFLCDSVGCLEYKYRIVRIVETNSLSNVHIFSSEEGQWSKSFIPLSEILNAAKFMKIRMIAYNRMLHMLSAHGVIVFDPFHKPPKVCRTIDLPVDLTFSLCTCLGECRGRLRLGVQFGVILDSETDHNKLNVWELEDYNNGKWCWAYKICIKNSVFQGLSIMNDRCWMIQILAFHPNNGNIVYLRIGMCIVEYNMQQKKIETSCPIDTCSNFSLLKPVTLTHQNWPTTLPSLP